MRTVFSSSFIFVTIWANLKQNDGSTVVFGANFDQQERCAPKFCMAFFTGFGFLTIRANLKENDSWPECFDANFEQQESCARCFGEVFAL